MKKVKSSLSSSRLQYPLLMLLLLVMEGVSTVLTVMGRSGEGPTRPVQKHVDRSGEVLAYLNNNSSRTLKSQRASSRPSLIQKEKYAFLL